MRITIKKVLLIVLGFQILLISIIKHYPKYVEDIYSNGIFLFISRAMRYFLGWIPFSIGDVFYTLAGIYILRWVFINAKRIVKDTKMCLLDIGSALSIAYFSFHILWGYNYYRQPLHVALNIKSDYTTAELIEFTERLIEKSNAIHHALSNDKDSLKIALPYTRTQVYNKIKKGYDVLANQYPHLNYQPQSIKSSLYSLPLTHMGFSGYLNPFTIEAQVNAKIPIYKLPTTASHEAAHQLGYAAENEANFIGALAAINNTDTYFKYSGYTFILKYCLMKLSLKDEKAYDALICKLNFGILKNYEEVQAFWMSYDGVMETVFEKTYDSFLKANNQLNGMRSYGYVVALMVNYYKSRPL